MVALAKIAEFYGLKYSERTKVAYGEIGGIPYTIVAGENPNFAMLETTVNVEASGKRGEINAELVAKAKTIKKTVSNFIVSPFSIKAQVNVVNLKKVSLLADVFQYINGVVATYSLKPCCSM